MFARHLRSSRFSAMNALIALALCYAMMVQGIVTHIAKFWTEQNPLHALCLSVSEGSSQNPFSDYPTPDHVRHSACCLIFGNGDIPRSLSLVSVLAFRITFSTYALTKLSKANDNGIAYTPVLPRAPPRIG